MRRKYLILIDTTVNNAYNKRIHTTNNRGLTMNSENEYNELNEWDDFEREIEENEERWAFEERLEIWRNEY